MPLPIRPSPNPKLNAPLTAGGIGAAFIIIYNATSNLGLPASTVAVIAVVLVVLTTVAQLFTKPNGDTDNA